MPVFSLGCMRSMHSWDDLAMEAIPGENQKNLRAIIDRALELGINHIETARGYGSSERQLGQILPDLRRDSFILQTKIPPSKDPEIFASQVQESLDRLNMDHVDLLSIHGINDHRSFWYACRKGGCFDAAKKLQAQGKINFIGFSGHGDTEIIRQAVRFDNHGGFDYCNIHWYYIFQQNWPAIVKAHARDMGVFIISPTDKGGMLQSPPTKLVRFCKPLSPMQFNDLFCLSHPEIKTISIGAANRENFDAHLEILPLLEKKDPIWQDIDAKWKKAMKEAIGHPRPDWLWETLPTWEHIPGYINFRLIHWLHNLVKGWGLTDYAKNRYAKLGQEMPWVPGMNGRDIEQVDLSDIAWQAKWNPEEIIPVIREAHRLLASPQPALEE